MALLGLSGAMSSSLDGRTKAGSPWPELTMSNRLLSRESKGRLKALLHACNDGSVSSDALRTDLWSDETRRFVLKGRERNSAPEKEHVLRLASVEKHRSKDRNKRLAKRRKTAAKKRANHRANNSVNRSIEAPPSETLTLSDLELAGVLPKEQLSLVREAMQGLTDEQLEVLQRNLEDDVSSVVNRFCESSQTIRTADDYYDLSDEIAKERSDAFWKAMDKAE